MNSQTIDPGRNKQLFLDDHAIESMSGVKRSLHRPVRYGPVLKPDRELGQTMVQSGSSPQWNPEKGIWEWWYTAFYDEPPYQGPGSKWITHPHYATSADGVHWERPSLGLYEFRGSTDNNIAYHSQLDFLRRRGGRHPVDIGERRLVHIIRDEQDPDAGRRYKGIFSNEGYSGRYPGVSPDGFHWTFPHVPPVPSNDTSSFIYDDINSQYVLTVKQNTEWGRSVWLSTSQDFVEFTTAKLILHTDEVDRENRRRRVRASVEDPAYLTPAVVDEDADYIAQLYMMPLMTYEGMYVGFPLLFNPAGPDLPQMNYIGLNQVELAVSRDLYDWERVADRALFIRVEPWNGSENYGTMQVAVSGSPVVRDDEIWVYYMGARFRGMPESWDEMYTEYFKDLGAMTLAKLRLDGFVSLDADGEGAVVTKPFSLNGESLHVNAEAQNGELRVAILDAETMDPLPGLAESQCDPVNADTLRGRVSWRNGPQLAAEKPVRARFTLRNAKLYAFWLDSAAD